MEPATCPFGYHAIDRMNECGPLCFASVPSGNALPSWPVVTMLALRLPAIAADDTPAWSEFPKKQTSYHTKNEYISEMQL